MNTEVQTTTDFKVLQSAIPKQFKAMSARTLFATGADGMQLWDTYLASFPAGSNPIYKKRTEHDCSCCRSFIKNLGGVVNIVDGKMVTLWDFEAQVQGAYQLVAREMADFVRKHAVDNIFLHPLRLVGQPNSRQLLEDRSVKTWDHLFVNLPDTAVCRGEGIGPKLSEARATHDVMKRGLEGITAEAISTVLELIAQNSLYRGEEQKFAITTFREVQQRFLAMSEAERELFVWEHMGTLPQSVSRIRNTVIGTLLTDLSEGHDLEDAVKGFESKVAPANYKRPTALVTPAMVAQAQKTVNELGLATALERRYASIEDITVNNILFADREAKRAMNVFDQIAAGAAVDIKKLGKVEEISIEDFVANVLPSTKTLEILFENRHAGNMVSLVAPVDSTAKPLFKWPNGFSWSYAGDMADSIKERVKQAGGSVTGDYRASLAWFNFDDLDLHLWQPKRPEIYFGMRLDGLTGGNLDVDMNAHSGKTRSPVENITFPARSRMAEGEYKLFVHQFHKRESDNIGFQVEMEFDGVVWEFAYPKALKQDESVSVCRFKYSHKAGVEIIESLPSTQTSKTIWGLPTQAFHKVRVAMLSPNHWDGRAVGNRHYFFMLDRCVNDGTVRGFFNEFLGEALTPHRKVLEIVGAKMKTEASANQLSGIGFSTTRRDSILCRVAGSFTRTLKVSF